MPTISNDRQPLNPNPPNTANNTVGQGVVQLVPHAGLREVFLREQREGDDCHKADEKSGFGELTNHSPAIGGNYGGQKLFLSWRPGS